MLIITGFTNPCQVGDLGHATLDFAVMHRRTVDPHGVRGVARDGLGDDGIDLGLPREILGGAPQGTPGHRLGVLQVGFGCFEKPAQVPATSSKSYQQG
ncbi:MAG: hypothetical protein MUF54_18380 [Polyangiaceae bacterium]|nr:hypothetical protein [Polyangiaceae bacterium]